MPASVLAKLDKRDTPKEPNTILSSPPLQMYITFKLMNCSMLVLLVGLIVGVIMDQLFVWILEGADFA